MGALSRSGMVDIWNREVEIRSPRFFARRIGGSEALVKRLEIRNSLIEHTDPVSSLTFNSEGNILASCSYDGKIALWDWDARVVKLEFLQLYSPALFVPFSEDKRMVAGGTIAGELRLVQIQEGGRVDTFLLGNHEMGVTGLAVVSGSLGRPGSPDIVYSCGIDGYVKRFDLRTRYGMDLLYCISTRGEEKALHSIAFDPTDPNRFALGGDDELIRIYDTRRCKLDGSRDNDRPCETLRLIDSASRVLVNSIKFSHKGELLANYTYDYYDTFHKMVLFPKKEILGQSEDDNKPEYLPPRVFEAEDPVPAEAEDRVNIRERFTREDWFDDLYSVEKTDIVNIQCGSFFGPNSEYVIGGVTINDRSFVSFWRKSDGMLLRTIDVEDIVDSFESHPSVSVIASNSKGHNNVNIWMPN